MPRRTTPSRSSDGRPASTGSITPPWPCSWSSPPASWSPCCASDHASHPCHRTGQAPEHPAGEPREGAPGRAGAAAERPPTRSAALQGRVPDLVLTTSLISPRDDSALAAHLRELGSAAAHVQTVTIPLLGSAAPKRAKGGMLAALRREKPQAPMTDGCEPDVFAEQVRQYLAHCRGTEGQRRDTRRRRCPDVRRPRSGRVRIGCGRTGCVRAGAPRGRGPRSGACRRGGSRGAGRDRRNRRDRGGAGGAPKSKPSWKRQSSLRWKPSQSPKSSSRTNPRACRCRSSCSSCRTRRPSSTHPSSRRRSSRRLTFEAPATEPIAEPRAGHRSRRVATGEPISEPCRRARAAAGRQTSTISTSTRWPRRRSTSCRARHRRRRSPEGIPAERPGARRRDALVPEPRRDCERAGRRARRSGTTASTIWPACLRRARRRRRRRRRTRQRLNRSSTSPRRCTARRASSRRSSPNPAPARAPKPVEDAGHRPEPVRVAGGRAGRSRSKNAAPIIGSSEPEPIFVAERIRADPRGRTGTGCSSRTVVARRSLRTARRRAEPEPVVSELMAAPNLEAARSRPPKTRRHVRAGRVRAGRRGARGRGGRAGSSTRRFRWTWTRSLSRRRPRRLQPAEASRFSFTLVDGFGDAWSDFDVPTIAAVAADLGVGDHSSLDPYAARPSAPAAVSREASTEPTAAPALDEEALSLIGDAARKVGLDALVIEEFERGLTSPRPKKAKKKVHVGATQVPAPGRAGAQAGQASRAGRVGHVRPRAVRLRRARRRRGRRDPPGRRNARQGHLVLILVGLRASGRSEDRPLHH